MKAQKTEHWALFLPMQARQDELKEAARTHDVMILSMISIRAPELVLNPWSPGGPKEKILGKSVILKKVRSMPVVPTH